MEHVRIIGVDPGFGRLGVCVLDKEKNKETLVYSVCLETSKKDTFENRLTFIGESFELLLKKYKPHELAIETIFFTTNQKTIITVAEVRGVILYLSKKHNLSIHEYSPPQIKLAIAGHGKASKEDIAHMVPKILKGQVKSGLIDDELDAIAIALTHSAQRKTLQWG